MSKNNKNKSKHNQQIEDISKKYTIGAELGVGGNAHVLEATSISSGEKVALKMITPGDKVKQSRFIDEIKVMKADAASVEGVMPIIDSSEEHYWYTMPIATKVMESNLVKDGDVVSIVEAFIPLLNTLQTLHDKNISHRDIKPDNIYILNKRLTLGDFGLVDYPNRANVTQSDRPLGAIFTRAPEMLRNPKTADGKPADVYSMAKTLWMLLSKDEKGFDGQYNERDDAHWLNGFEHLKDEHLLDIEKLITKATSTNPSERPTASGFVTGLNEWLEIYKDGALCQIKDWEHLSEILFNGMNPDTASYKDVNNIVKVLDIIAHSPAYNHMFVPKRGGLDLNHVEMATEDGCIKILGNGCWLILKPKRLYFRGFNDIAWNYFLLETENLAPVLSVENNDGWYESVVEDVPGHYVVADDACYGVYDYDSGKPLPEGWMCAERVLQGKFLFVMKLGHYNHISATYDARHCHCSEQEFYDLISKYERIYDDGLRQGYSEKQILSHHKFTTNPFEGEVVEKEQVSLPSPKDYIDSHFKEWVFDMPQTDDKKGAMTFYFIFDIMDWNYHSFFSDPKEYVLTASGKIEERKKGDEDGVFFVPDREKAFQIEEQLDSQIQAFCDGYDTDYSMVFFKIGWKRIGKPIHLFTWEEFEKLYKEADDRRGNKLVIDEYGYARFMPADTEGTAYPVCHETFHSRRNNVGKYSPLRTMKSDYMESLDAWLTHLRNGGYVYCDGSIFPDRTESELIEEIRKYY